MFKLFKKDKNLDSVTQENAILRGMNQEQSKAIRQLKSELEFHIKENGKLRKERGHIDICRTLDENDDVISYLPTDTEKLNQYLGEVSKLSHNTYLNDIFTYLVNSIANLSLRKREESYDHEKAKYIIDGVLAVKQLLKDGDQALLDMIESKKPITQDEQNELIRSSIEDVINK